MTITDHIRSAREGNVFSRVCRSVCLQGSNGFLP